MKLLILLLYLCVTSLEAATITNWGAQLPTAVPASGDVILMQKGGVTYYFTPNQLATQLSTNANLTVAGAGSTIVTNANQFGASTTLTLKSGLLATNPTFYGSVGIGTTTPNATFQVADFVNFSTTNQSMYIGFNSGDFPLQANTAIGNTVVGHNALTNINSNSVGDNTAIGVNVMRVLTTGRANTAVGADIMILATTANNNSAIGDAALLDLTTGYYNAAGGSQALRSLTTGFDNTAFGGFAGAELTVGYYNVAMGRDALLVDILGNQNTAVGATTLKASTNGSDNVAVGTSAGFALHSGHRNILIGSQCASTLLSGSSNIMIGYGIEFPFTTFGQRLSIGNLIYAVELNGGGTNISNGRVGIGTLEPVNKFDIKGAVAAGTYGGVNAAPADGFIVSGVVGIGTASPTSKLTISDGATPFAAGVGGMLQLIRTGGNTDATNAVRFRMGNTAGNLYDIVYGGTSDRIGFVSGGGVETFTVSGTGQVGIGTAVPASTLDVTGQVRSASAIFTNSVTVTGTTNQLIFGNTNPAPASAVSPTKWISVQITGDATLYRLPLYQ